MSFIRIFLLIWAAVAFVLAMLASAGAIMGGNDPTYPAMGMVVAVVCGLVFLVDPRPRRTVSRAAWRRARAAKFAGHKTLLGGRS